MGGPVLNHIPGVAELDTKEFKNNSMFMILLSGGLTDVSHKIITNYILQNEFRTSFVFDIKKSNPATDSKQTVIDLKNFVNDEQLYQIKVINIRWCYNY